MEVTRQTILERRKNFIHKHLAWNSKSVNSLDKNVKNSVNQLIFVMVKYGVLFEVRTEFLNNI
jgi:hypothetical protein